MSVAALSGMAGFRHSVEDDLESAFYCVLYIAVQSLPHSKPGSICEWMNKFFYEHIDADLEGGYTKTSYLIQPKRFTQQFEFDTMAIERWFDIAFSYLSTTLPVVREAKLWEPKKVQKLFSGMRTGNNLPENDWKDLVDRVLPKDITEPIEESRSARSSRTRNKRSRVEINENNGRPIRDELRDRKKRKGHVSVGEREATMEGDSHACRGTDAETQNGRRIIRSVTRRATARSSTK